MAADAQTPSSDPGSIPSKMAASSQDGVAPGRSASGVASSEGGLSDRAQSQPGAPAGYGDQLARIEDKTARIEDKYARSEALLARVEEKVEGAALRMNEAARQSDLIALRSEMRGIGERLRRVPGTGALILTALVTAVLTVILMIAVQRLNLDSYIPQRTTPAAQP